MSGNSSATIEPLRKPVACPSCNTKSARESYPFCSVRCRELDLHSWFSDGYAIAGDPCEETLPEN